MIFPVLNAINTGEDDELGDHLTTPRYAGTTTSVGFYHLKYDKNTDTIIPLEDAAAASGSPLSSLNSQNGSSYQVPVGKKLVFICSIKASTSTGTLLKIRSSATADTADGTVIYDQTRTINNVVWFTTPVLEVAAQQYLTVEYVSGAGSVTIFNIIGYETDA